MNNINHTVLGTILFLLAGGCTGTDVTRAPEASGSTSSVHTISLTASHATVAIGGSIQLMVVLKNRTGSVVAGQNVAYFVNFPFATVSGSGLVKGISQGIATVTASAGGKSASLEIPVIDPLGNPSLRILKFGDTLQRGVTYQIPYFHSNQEIEATPGLPWLSHNNYTYIHHSGNPFRVTTSGGLGDITLAVSNGTLMLCIIPAQNQILPPSTNRVCSFPQHTPSNAWIVTVARRGTTAISGATLRIE